MIPHVLTSIKKIVFKDVGIDKQVVRSQVKGFLILVHNTPWHSKNPFNLVLSLSELTTFPSALWLH